MLFMERDAPFAEFRLIDAQQMPAGYWVVVQVFPDQCPDVDGLWRLRLLWKRSHARKKYRTLRLRGPVVPTVSHEVDPILVDDWVIGVRHGQTYGFFVDTAHHEIDDAEDVLIDAQLQPITVLDMIAACSSPALKSEPQS